MNSEETKNPHPPKSKPSLKKYIDKKYWKIYVIIFAALALIAALIVWLCLPKGNDDPKETPPVVNPPADPPVLAEGEKLLTSVSISGGDTPAEVTAVAELKSYLQKKGVTVDESNTFPITLSIDSSLDDDAFRVSATVGEDKPEGMTIVGGNGRGVLYGVYRFLEQCADVRFFTPELEICNAGDVIVSDGVMIDYTPVFEMRQTDWYRWISGDETYVWATKAGINLISGWLYSWGEELGGSLAYAPSLFVHTIGKLAELDTPYPATAPNPCLSDEAVYNTVLKNVLKALEENPDTKILSVSQNDNPTHCKCDTCAAIDAEEGSPAGSLLRFVNRIANAVAPLYPDVTIDTLAYDYTLPTPKITVPAENVCIRLSTINCHFNHPLTTKNCYGCSQFSNAIEDWGKICDNLYVWDYTTNYRHYLLTFPNFHVLRQNMQFFAEHNVKGVYEQGNASSQSGEFGELRAYLLAKLMMNPYMSNEEYYAHMDEFLAAYYGAGWENIRKYINTFTTYAKASIDGMGIYTGPFTVIKKESVKKLKDRFTEWWDAAEAAAGDRLEYVQRSRLQLRYLLLFVDPNKEEATALINGVEGNKIYWREGQSKLLWYVYDDRWNLLEKAPDKWFIDPSKN